MEKKLVTLPVNGMWQPCGAEEAKGRTAEFWAFPARFAVVSEFGTRHHGRWWDREDAERFARTMWGPATVEETTPYWYAPAFGRVDA